jgi:hypothetical protein
MAMNIYRISQDIVDGWGTYDSAVVIAPDEGAAQRTHPDDNLPPSIAWRCVLWVNDPAQVTVELIGVAAEGSKAGVVVASLNAG